MSKVNVNVQLANAKAKANGLLSKSVAICGICGEKKFGMTHVGYIN